MRKYSSNKDLKIIIIFIIIIIVTLITRPINSGANSLYVEINGKVELVKSLEENALFSPSALPNVVIEIKNGSCRFISSDCPDKICIHSGYLSTNGQTAACLPNRILLRIVNENDNKMVDAITK